VAAPSDRVGYNSSTSNHLHKQTKTVPCEKCANYLNTFKNHRISINHHCINPQPPNTKLYKNKASNFYNTRRNICCSPKDFSDQKDDRVLGFFSSWRSLKITLSFSTITLKNKGYSLACCSIKNIWI